MLASLSLRCHMNRMLWLCGLSEATIDSMTEGPYSQVKVTKDSQNNLQWVAVPRSPRAWTGDMTGYRVGSARPMTGIPLPVEVQPDMTGPSQPLEVQPPMIGPSGSGGGEDTDPVETTDGLVRDLNALDLNALD